MPTLKEARAARLLTVRGLADRAGVASSTVYLIENGRSTPRFTVIERLSRALGVVPTEIEEFQAAMHGVAEGKMPRRRQRETPDDSGVGNPHAGDKTDAKESGA